MVPYQHGSDDGVGTLLFGREALYIFQDTKEHTTLHFCPPLDRVLESNQLLPQVTSVGNVGLGVPLLTALLDRRELGQSLEESIHFQTPGCSGTEFSSGTSSFDFYGSARYPGPC